jgi:transposase
VTLPVTRPAGSQGAAPNDKFPLPPGTGQDESGRSSSREPVEPVGRDDEGLGRSRGGLSTKLHLAADDRARPLALVVTAGQRGDSPQFVPVLDKVRIRRRGPGRPRTRPDVVRADKAYSSGANRAYLRRRGIVAVIPIKEDQKAARRNRGSAGGRPPRFDAGSYRTRNCVERAINKLKQYRAVASRYDKRRVIYQGTVQLAAIRIWLRDPVT